MGFGFMGYANAQSTGMVQVTCTNGTYAVGWDNSNSFFNGKGNIAALYCDIVQHTGYISDNLSDPTLRYYQGVLPVQDTQTTIVETQTVVAQPVETPTSVSPVDSQTATSDSVTVVVDSQTATLDTSTTSTETQTVVQETQTATTDMPQQESLPTPSPVVEPQPIVVPQPQPLPQPQPAPLPVVEQPIVVPDVSTVTEPVVEEPAPVEEPSAHPTEEDTNATPSEETSQEQSEPNPEPSPEPIVEPEPASQPDIAPEPPVSEPQIVEASKVDVSTLPPDTPVLLDNGVILTAEVVVALQLLENPAELLGELFTDPAQALTAISNIGADMSPEVRDKSEKVVVSAIIAGGIATQAAGLAASATYRRND